ncbi:MAG: hypothetical protein ACFFEE_03700 [Candidatus Thorarchaeota archaeon]
MKLGEENVKLRILVVTMITIALTVQAVSISDAQCLLPIILANPAERGAHSSSSSFPLW